MYTRKILFNKRPIYLVITASIVAVCLLALFILKGAIIFNLSFLIFILSFFLLLLYSIIHKKFNLLLTLIISIIFVAIILINGFFNIYKHKENDYNKNFRFVGEVCEIKNYEYIDDLHNYTIVVKGNILGKENKALLNLTLKDEFFVGSKIKFNGYFYKNASSFDDKLNSTALSDKVYYRVSNVKDISIDNNVYGVFNKAKLKLLTEFKRLMPNVYPFAYALITGNSSYFSNEEILSFRQSGVSHILAVSGLHIGFLYGLINFILKLLKIKKGKSFIITAFILLLYVWFCGFSNSSLRAFLIILIYNLATILGLKGDRITIAFMSMLAILLINPFDFFTIGFALSFSAYFSIIILSKPFEKALSNVFTDSLSKSLSTYIVAYLGTLPLIVNYFNSVSLFSILFNIIVLPLCSVAFICNTIFSVSVLLLPNAYLFSILPNVLLNLITSVVVRADTSLFLIENYSFKYSIIFYYLALLFCSKLLNVSKKVKIISIFISLLSFILIFCTINSIYNLDFFYWKC